MHNHSSLNPSLARTALFLLNCQCFDKSIFLLIFLNLYEVDSSLLVRYQIMQYCSEVSEFWNRRRGWQSMWIEKEDVFSPGLFILVLGPSSVSAPSGLWRRMRNWQWLMGTITTLWGRTGLKHRSGTSWNWKLSRLPSKSDVGAPSPFSKLKQKLGSMHYLYTENWTTRDCSCCCIITLHSVLRDKFLGY